MAIYQLGQLNTTALQAPGLYVQIVPPTNRYINGVPTDILGIVGVGSWGPVNAPVPAGNLPQAIQAIGNVTNRARDIATAVAVAVVNGASNFRLVRVTDGTDVAASANLMDTAATPVMGAKLTAYYTGTMGNSISAVLAAGTQASTYKLSLQMSGYAPEVFDNIGGTGATFWSNLVNAVNNGQGILRGPSTLCIATVGTSTAAPNLTTYTLSGGTDGSGSVTDTTVVGTDGTTRTGMYALRSSGAQVGLLVDNSTPSTWSGILSFGLSEGIYFPVANAAGTSVATSGSNLSGAGADGYALKVMVGDWCYWQDNFNNTLRLLSPATFAAAWIAGHAPQESSLNKPLFGIVATQRNQQNLPYSDAEIGQCVTSRLDVITNPCPGGQYFGCRTGQNASSNPSTNGDNYTRMTDYVGLTLAASFGWVVGKLQTTDLRRTAKSSTETFLANLQSQGQIGDVNNPGKPAYQVTLDASNNPAPRVALGYMQMDVKVVYLSIVKVFLVNLEGGQTVTITHA